MKLALEMTHSVVLSWLTWDQEYNYSLKNSTNVIVIVTVILCRKSAVELWLKMGFQSCCVILLKNVFSILCQKNCSRKRQGWRAVQQIIPPTTVNHLISSVITYLSTPASMATFWSALHNNIVACRAMTPEIILSTITDVLSLTHQMIAKPKSGHSCS